jgi:hypothetical protein
MHARSASMRYRIAYLITGTCPAGQCPSAAVGDRPACRALRAAGRGCASAGALAGVGNGVTVSACGTVSAVDRLAARILDRAAANAQLRAGFFGGAASGSAGRSGTAYDTACAAVVGVAAQGGACSAAICLSSATGGRGSGTGVRYLRKSPVTAGVSTRAAIARGARPRVGAAAVRLC